MNKLFKAVPVSEKPPIIPGYPNGFICLLSNGGLDERWWIEEENGFCYWSTAREQYELCDETIGWLRPLPQPTKEAEQRAKELYPDVEFDKSVYHTAAEWRSDQNEMLSKRAAYLKGHSEADQSELIQRLQSTIATLQDMLNEKGASTGQAGEIKQLRNALNQINQFSDAGSDLNALVAMKRIASKALSTPSHTVEPDKVEEEIKRHSDTWEAAVKWEEEEGWRYGLGTTNKEPDKKTYLEQLKEKLKQL